MDADIVINTMKPEQNGRHFADGIFKCIFLIENLHIWIEISLEYIPEGSMDNNSALVYEMALHQTGNKPLPQPMPIKLYDALWHH